MALENVGSFQYLLYKNIRKKIEKKKIQGCQFLIPGAQMALEIFGLFDPDLN